MTNLNPYLLGGGAAYHVTFFPDRFGKTLDPQRATLQGLAATISCATRKQKHELPLLKLARFGDQRSDEGSLRHNDNVLAITGVELDYDGEQMSFEEAVATVRKAGLSALLYTSPSFTCEKPRWRILCPASRELEPEQRAKLTGRVNGVFGGILGKESFTLSQAFYFGALKSNPAHKVELVEGDFIDLREDLDAGAIGPPGGRRKTTVQALPDNVVALFEQNAGNGLSHDPEDLPEPVSPEKISAALAVIDPDINRQDWFAIGCALFNELGDEGFAIWNGWSSKGQKYNAKEMRGQWRSISKKNGYDFTVASVFYFADLADTQRADKN